MRRGAAVALIGGIEMGGTKLVCGVTRDGREPLRLVRLPTGTDPVAAIRSAAAFLSAMRDEHGPLDAIGIGAFGPCDPDPLSPEYGRITTTPKPGWAGTDVLSLLRAALHPAPPIVFDTDVNAAALGELHHGAGRGLDSLAYLTVGTGVGGGAVVGGRLVHGLLHPEMGHMRVRRPASESASFPGVCPFHGDCLEGVASGPAMAARWGRPAEHLPPDHPAWELAAGYLAEAVATVLYVLSPQRIVLGGGVGSAPHLIRSVGTRVVEVIAGYLRLPALGNGAADYVVAPELGGLSGIIGAFSLAERGGRG